MSRHQLLRTKGRWWDCSHHCRQRRTWKWHETRFDCLCSLWPIPTSVPTPYNICMRSITKAKASNEVFDAVVGFKNERVDSTNRLYKNEGSTNTVVIWNNNSSGNSRGSNNIPLLVRPLTRGGSVNIGPQRVCQNRSIPVAFFATFACRHRRRDNHFHPCLVV